MVTRLLKVTLAVVVMAAVIAAFAVMAPRASAQGIASEQLVQYLDRMAVTWKRDGQDPRAFRVTKTTGLKSAEWVEIVITNLPDKALVTLRAFPKMGGKFLSLTAARNREALMKAMLQDNATGFGAYFIDGDGDIGFRYVFTTESGVGYESFRVAVKELLRIADEAMVPLYNKYR